MEHHKPTTALFDVYLRLRPSSATERERFLHVERPQSHPDEPAAPTHITIHPPTNDHRKRAIERFAFTHVFEEHVGQREIFESTGILPLVEGVLGGDGREGRDGLFATLGVTGSGKSHTVLGSKSQRGITQLTLDLLFQHTAPYLADVETNPTIFSSLCAADVSEAQLLPAGQYLDSIYSPDNGGFSRATTPAMVRESTLPISRSSTAYNIPGSFPSLEDSTSSRQPTPAVFDRLYPSLTKYQRPTTPSHTSHTPLKSVLTRSITKLTSAIQESSFLSMPSSRKYTPRVSTLPQHPLIDDIGIDIDTNAQYAIVISMYEVYNDRIFDLLTASAGTKTPQKRRALLFKPTELSPDRKVVAGLRKVVCSSLEEALLVLETGLHERRVAGTGSNATSSRSHGFFCLDIKKRRRSHAPGPWTNSTLTIVDLAGSERARTAKTAGATLAEAGKINESLMYLGQCMQMQSDNARSSTVNGGVEKMVPFRQCKLTELLFSNSLASHSHTAHQKMPQKAVMIVTADPLGDFNATSQILRYSALAREVTVPRIPSTTSTILASSTAGKKDGPSASGRMTPSAVQEELEHALAEVAHLRSQLELSQVLLEEETQRRQAAEAAWKRAEDRSEEVEADLRDELWTEFETKLLQEQRRWRAARDAEQDAQDEHMDRKLELLTQQMTIYEDETAEAEKENQQSSPLDAAQTVAAGKVARAQEARDSAGLFALKYAELEDENAELRERLANAQREKEMVRSPSKSKMRVLKPSRKWQGSGMGVDDV